MSPYGGAPSYRPSAPAVPPTLLPRTFLLPGGAGKALTVFPVTRETVSDELVEYLRGVFNAVVEEGRTYPQLGEQSFEQFAGYFFGSDCFIGLLDTPPVGLVEGTPLDREHGYSLEAVRAGRSWQEAVLGMFYIKPNYPGRASHICNGGFVVPTVHRGLKVGVNMGRAFLHFAPKLGFRASIFNLVFINNHASVKCWDQLGFTRAGLIPGAGCLRTEDGKGEEYVDAFVYHYDFVKAAKEQEEREGK
ncbi:hypothetical protein BCR35DRAFT_302888 [Leucosporidium creatinivorum]|uniref:N-acetyltransferase domain-containing protein n=1 Tax=Leucosporidium creatinivorum TaxID=106004 RepID=A0A1Y2FN47_9BASI|nr:hypothetical protein BCR35DRAFT_302888 [Leucosporidium creatinivorum]